MAQNALLSPSAPHNQKVEIHLPPSEASGCMASMKSHKEYNKGPVLSRVQRCMTQWPLSHRSGSHTPPSGWQRPSPSDAWHGDVLSLANHSCNLPGNCCTCLLATPISNPSGGMQVITKIGGFVIEHIKNTWNQLPIDPIPSRWPQAPPSVVQSLTISASKTWAADLQGFNSLRVWGNLGNCMKLPKFPLNNRILDFWGSTPLKFCV